MCSFTYFYDSFRNCLRRLSNTSAHTLQVEPSPTTGSLFMLHQTAHASMTSAASASFPVTTACFNTNTVDDRKPSFFEFKPPSKSNMVMNYSILLLVKLKNINSEVWWINGLDIDVFFVNCI